MNSNCILIIRLQYSIRSSRFPGTFFDYFVRCDIKYNTSNDYTTAKNISELNPTYVYNNTGGSTWTRGVQMMIPDSFAGLFFIFVFHWIFNINGNTDHCIFPMTIHVVDYDDADFTFISSLHLCLMGIVMKTANNLLYQRTIS